MIVTVSGLSGLTKAYTSVLSAVGSWLMSGASRWLDAPARLTRVPSITATSVTMTNLRAVIVHSLLTNEGVSKGHRVVSPYTEGREELDCGPLRGLLTATR